MIEKCRTLYKGDMLAASFYLLVGMILLLFSIILYYFTISIGFMYLSIGFFMFFVYCIVKGSVMFNIAKAKYYTYINQDRLTTKFIQIEIDYTNFRIRKKNINRRRYIWMVVICSAIAFLGIFSSHKSILMGTSIPIALIAAIELSIGLLTEFRLREFLRILSKGDH